MVYSEFPSSRFGTMLRTKQYFVKIKLAAIDYHSSLCIKEKDLRILKLLKDKYSYALEKFSSAIYILATGAGDILDRLRDAFLGPLLMINHEHLPINLQEDFIWIERNITKYKEKWPGQLEELGNYEKQSPNFKGKHPEFYPNAIEATCRRIHKRTGVEIAKRIFNIYDYLNSQAT